MAGKKLVGKKLLRCGYTTGACAAGAAKAAALLLLTGKAPAGVHINLPAGPLNLAVLQTSLKHGAASCAVRKDAGDDPDITHGMLVYATLRLSPEGLKIEGGQGIGRIKPAISCHHPVF